MQALSESKEMERNEQPSKPPFEGTLRAPGQSTIEKLSQVPEFIELAESLIKGTERAGFEPAEPVRVHTLSKRAQSATLSPLPSRRRVVPAAAISIGRLYSYSANGQGAEASWRGFEGSRGAGSHVKNLICKNSPYVTFIMHNNKIMLIVVCADKVC